MFTVLPLQYAAEGHYNFNLGQTAVTLIPRFNYLCSVWVLDIIDAANNPILSGLVMVPKGEAVVHSMWGPVHLHQAPIRRPGPLAPCHIHA